MELKKDRFDILEGIFCMKTRFVMVFCLISVLICSAFCFANEKRIEAEQNVILGITHMKKNEMDKAHEYFLKANEIDPDYEKVHSCLGDYYRHLEMYSKAIESYKKALKLGGDKESINYAIGKCYYNSFDYKNALEHLRKVKTEELKDSKYYYILGQSLRKLKSPRKAVTPFKNSLYKNENNVNSRLALGYTYVELGNYRLARKEFQKVLKTPGATNEQESEARANIQKVRENVFKKQSWQLAIPIGVLIIIIPAFVVLKSQRDKLGENYEEEEEVEDFYG